MRVRTAPKSDVTVTPIFLQSKASIMNLYKFTIHAIQPFQNTHRHVLHQGHVQVIPRH